MAAADPVVVYRETVGALYGFVVRRCGADRALAEDVTQETYMRYVAQCRDAGAPTPALPWLEVVARNLLLNYFRRRRPVSVDSGILDCALAPAPVELSDDQRAEAARAIAWGLTRLKPSWARLIEDFHLEGRSVGALAAATGLSERAVEGRLRRARAALRSALQPLIRTQENHNEH